MSRHLEERKIVQRESGLAPMRHVADALCVQQCYRSYHDLVVTMQEPQHELIRVGGIIILKILAVFRDNGHANSHYSKLVYKYPLKEYNFLKMLFCYNICFL